MHPNERLLRQEYEARAGRDDTSLADLFADDIVWHVPGRSTISGDYRGKEQVMEYVRLRRELAAGTFEIDVQDVLANDQYGWSSLAAPPEGHGNLRSPVQSALRRVGPPFRRRSVPCSSLSST